MRRKFFSAPFESVRWSGRRLGALTARVTARVTARCAFALRCFATGATVALVGVGCTQQSVSVAPRIPEPGRERVMQIYYLTETGVPAQSWRMPAVGDLQSQMGARVERAEIKTESEAAELLRVWNARPMDLLLLGPGVPQKVFPKLQLPRVSQRLTLALENDKSNDKWIGVKLNEADVQKFLRGFCASKMAPRGCALEPNLPAELTRSIPVDRASPLVVSLGKEISNALDGREVTLSIVPEWGALVRHLKQSQSFAMGGAAVNLDFRSGF